MKTPNWFDLRVVAGVVLVIGSMVAGALTIAAADSTTRVWAVTRDLAPGTILTSDDIKPISVRLPSVDGYFVTGGKGNEGSVIGKSVARQLYEGEPLPRRAVETTAPATTLTVPLSSDQAPRLTRGGRIELWLSSKTCQAVVILASVTVQDVQSAGGGGFGTSASEAVVIRVPSDDAVRVITALGLDGTVIRAGVLNGNADPAANEPLDDLEHCGVSA